MTTSEVVEGDALVAAVWRARPKAVTICGSTGCGYSQYAAPLLVGGASVNWLNGVIRRTVRSHEVAVVMHVRGDKRTSEAIRRLGLSPDDVAALQVGQAFLVYPN